ncbi:RNA polymerase sigma-70 factor (sigma-E family) [Thermocatellispora tengchongensis]|uniref:RNA polymerase sigma-70 factor (Sigma-E family) n=1 Tax=Thermocatellispora tengchongensis TaxID=1073253 RepID=A0A840P0B5_9ACTN|nr:SigE family RNA polymerase sigma factor [Thermocatellispora tengchongensis]MBB5130707.1 RNA polymerase sigma-70 factor (sigma-E family) [Thermocatellispora tengchongensis]
MDAAAERRFREFVSARSPALMRLAYLLTGGDQHAAEDLLQAALTQTVAKWRTVESPEAYVRQVMYRQQVSWWRLARTRRETAMAEPPETAGPDATAGADLKIVVRRALARLTAKQRAVLVLRYFEDLPESEVAAVLGCSVGNVRSTAHRSLARLRELAPELSRLEEPGAPATILGEVQT